MKKSFLLALLILLPYAANASVRCMWLETKLGVTNEAAVSAEYASKETFCKLANQFIKYADEYLQECAGKSQLGLQGTVGKVINNKEIFQQKCRGYSRTISDDVPEWLSKDTNGASNKDIEQLSVATSKCTEYQITASMLNVRNAPSRSAAILGRYKRGKVCVYSVNNGWARTEHGYISAKYIIPMGNIRSNQDMYKVVNIRSNDTLSVRTGPGTEYHKIGDLPYNAKGVKLGTCKTSKIGGLWCIVNYNNIKGWASTKYLQKIKLQNQRNHKQTQHSSMVDIDTMQNSKNQEQLCEDFINYQIVQPDTSTSYEKFIKINRHALNVINRQYKECKRTRFEMSDNWYYEATKNLKKYVQYTKNDWEEARKKRWINNTGAPRDHWTGWGPNGNLPGPDFQP